MRRINMEARHRESNGTLKGAYAYNSWFTQIHKLIFVRQGHKNFGCNDKVRPEIMVQTYWAAGQASQGWTQRQERVVTHRLSIYLPFRGQPIQILLKSDTVWHSVLFLSAAVLHFLVFAPFHVNGKWNIVGCLWTNMLIYCLILERL